MTQVNTEKSEKVGCEVTRTEGEDQVRRYAEVSRQFK